MTNEDTEVLENYIRDMINGWMNTNWDFYDPDFNPKEEE